MLGEDGVQEVDAELGEFGGAARGDGEFGVEELVGEA